MASRKRSVLKWIPIALLMLLPSGCSRFFIGDELYHFDVAVRLQQEGEYIKALEHYRKALQQDSSYSPLYSRLAECFLAINSLDSARYYWKRAIEVHPGNVHAHMNLLYLQFLDKLKEQDFSQKFSVWQTYDVVRLLLSISRKTGLMPELILLIGHELSALRADTTHPCGGAGLFLLSRQFADSVGLDIPENDSRPDDRQNPLLVFPVIGEVLARILPESKESANLLNLHTLLNTLFKTTTCLDEETIQQLSHRISEKFKDIRNDTVELSRLINLLLAETRRILNFTSQENHTTQMDKDPRAVDDLLWLVNNLKSYLPRFRSLKDRSILHHNLGVASFYLNDVKAAEYHFLQAYALDSLQVERALTIARFFLVTQNYRRALYFYHQALNREPERPDIMLELAEANLLAGNFKAARSWFQTLLHDNPFHSRGRQGMAILDAIDHRFDEAAERLTPISTRANADYLLLYHLGLFKTIQQKLSIGFPFSELGSYRIAPVDFIPDFSTENRRDTETTFRPFRWPVDDGEFPSITSFYGWRVDPLADLPPHWLKFHRGIDIDGSTGDPVFAPADGIVVFAAYKGSFGNTILIRHHFENGKVFTTGYHHLHEILVKKGDRVKSGQVIGLIGSTGRVTGDHLHFEIQIDGELVDPLYYLQIIERYRVRME